MGRTNKFHGANTGTKTDSFSVKTLNLLNNIHAYHILKPDTRHNSN